MRRGKWEESGGRIWLASAEGMRRGIGEELRRARTCGSTPGCAATDVIGGVALVVARWRWDASSPVSASNKEENNIKGNNMFSIPMCSRNVPSQWIISHAASEDQVIASLTLWGLLNYSHDNRSSKVASTKKLNRLRRKRCNYSKLQDIMFECINDIYESCHCQAFCKFAVHLTGIVSSLMHGLTGYLTCHDLISDRNMVCNGI
ncbi:hypothetical protein OPV22_016951 [Ensete ventricosum]|uniref:Uncharacterized protein n=1 Tax=Ensete ventricosum TaxID=4639 RepID=A0AAV8PEF6_ENSVE|nr:hypothetical protein OPV22_016951 [Ensete ventricosum]